MRVTSTDVARRAEVSQATVSRALRDLPGMSLATRHRVREAARELGYVPIESGRSLATQRSRRVGIVVGELSNPFYPMLVDPMVSELDAHGYLAVLIHDDGATGPNTEPIFDGSLDAVVLTTLVDGSSLPDALERRGIPFVMVNREVRGCHRSRSAAVPDNVAGAAMLADLLADLGHIDMGVIAGPSRASTSAERLSSFRDALARRGIALHPDAVRHVPYSVIGGQQAASEILAARSVTALFCANDVLAIGALDKALASGRQVPEDLTIVGFDDVPLASLTPIGLTTIAVDLNGLGRWAIKHLVERIEDPCAEMERHVQPVRLVSRRTHGIPAL